MLKKLQLKGKHKYTWYQIKGKLKSTWYQFKHEFQIKNTMGWGAILESFLGRP